jgi:hypothetical protein
MANPLPHTGYTEMEAPKLIRLDRATHCTRCSKGVQEDIMHCIWNCPHSLVVWDWVRRVLQLAAVYIGTNLELKLEHVLLAEDLPAHFRILKKLWAILRAVPCWEICIIWYRLDVYLRLFWRHKFSKIKTKRLDPVKAQLDMQQDFGRCPQIWYLHNLRLSVDQMAP